MLVNRAKCQNKRASDRFVLALVLLKLCLLQVITFYHTINLKVKLTRAFIGLVDLDMRCSQCSGKPAFISKKEPCSNFTE